MRKQIKVSTEGHKARLNLLLDAELKSWVLSYSKQRGIKITRLITGFFQDLRDKENGIDVEQI